jgi:hypothetical protein
MNVRRGDFPPKYAPSIKQRHRSRGGLGQTLGQFSTLNAPPTCIRIAAGLVSDPMKLCKLLIFAGYISLAGCGYPPPNAVGVVVDTIPRNAACAVSRDGRPVGHIDSTPGIVLVPNEEADYLVACRRNAYQEVSTVVHARAETTSPFYYLGSKELHSRGGASLTFPLVPTVAVATHPPSRP